MTWPLLKIKSSRKKQNKHMKNMSFSLPAAASDAGFFYSLFFLLDLYTTWIYNNNIGIKWQNLKKKNW